MNHVEAKARRDQYRRRAVAILEALGDTPAAVARSLQRSGIKAYRNRTISRPLLDTYLAVRLGLCHPTAVVIYADMGRASVSLGRVSNQGPLVAVDLPAPVSEYARGGR